MWSDWLLPNYFPPKKQHTYRHLEGHVWKPNPGGLGFRHPQIHGKHMFNNCKSLRIWTLWKSSFLRIFRSNLATSPGRICKSSLLWTYAPKPIFPSYMYQYAPISTWNPQLYKSSYINPYSKRSLESSSADSSPVTKRALSEMPIGTLRQVMVKTHSY